MTIRATNSTYRPTALNGTKAPAPAAMDDTPSATARGAKGDRLALSPQATEVAADDLNAAVLAKVRGTAGTTTPEVTTPESKQPETTKAETTTSQSETAKTEANKSEAATSQTRTETPEKKPEADKKPLFNHTSYFSQTEHFKQQQPVIEAALAGQPASFKNLLGASVDVAITKGANTSDGYEQYQLKVGTGSFKVTVAPDQDIKALLTKVVEYYSRFPEHMRDGLKSIALETRQNPEDAYWAKVYGNDSFSSAATAGNGAISFWHLKDNPINLSEDTFNHEMGHLLGEAQHTKGPEHGSRVPVGWQEAAKADDDQVSHYAGMNPDEDFAETWSYYLYARTDAKAMEALRERVPNRLKILDALYEKAEGKVEQPATSPEAPQQPEGKGNG